MALKDPQVRPSSRQRPPSRMLAVGVWLALGTIAALGTYTFLQVRKLRDEQTAISERNRKDSLQLLRIQNNLASVAMLMRDMADRTEPYPLAAWRQAFDRLRARSRPRRPRSSRRWRRPRASRRSRTRLLAVGRRVLDATWTTCSSAAAPTSRPHDR